LEEKLDKVSEGAFALFNDEKIQTQMKLGGSSMRVMGREELREMWQERHDYLEELFAGLGPRGTRRGCGRGVNIPLTRGVRQTSCCCTPGLYDWATVP
jgi:hypothetical protein